MNGRLGVEAGRRVRVERGVYRQPNGKYGVCFISTAGRGFARSRAISTRRAERVHGSRSPHKRACCRPARG
jgi:hypothetical protein